MKPSDLPGAIRESKQAIERAIRKGKIVGAERAVTRLKAVKVPIDRGHYRAAWRVVVSAGGSVSVVNDSPMAGVIELGARSHAVSVEGQQALLEWVMRHEVPEKEAHAVVWAIVQRLKKQGQPGRFVVRGLLDDMTRDVSRETERAIREELKDKK